MDLGKRTLARIDRRIFSGLDHNEQYHMVRVPVSEAAWSTGRRCCKAQGVATGRGVAELIAYELGTVEASTTSGGAVFVGELQGRLVARAEGQPSRESTGAGRVARQRKRSSDSSAVPSLSSARRGTT